MHPSDSHSAAKLIRTRIQEAIDVKQQLLAMTPALDSVAQVLTEAYRRGHKAIFFGNGGSAADAQHLAAEFLGRFYHDRAPLPALALNVNTSVLTAIGNDYSYTEVFSRQIQALGAPGDVAVGISTSGNSPNVVAALEVARRSGLQTVALTGAGGGKMRDVAEFCIAVPSKDTPRVQECHILIGHLWCEFVEQCMMPATNKSAA